MVAPQVQRPRPAVGVGFRRQLARGLAADPAAPRAALVGTHEGALRWPQDALDEGSVEAFQVAECARAARELAAAARQDLLLLRSRFVMHRPRARRGLSSAASRCPMGAGCGPAKVWAPRPRYIWIRVRSPLMTEPAEPASPAPPPGKPLHPITWSRCHGSTQASCQ
jgi:hypothetical protein